MCLAHVQRSIAGVVDSKAGKSRWFGSHLKGSLKRALAIRQVLIDDGVSPDRIDVRAMGGVDDTGPTDRVDVYTKA